MANTKGKKDVMTRLFGRRRAEYRLPIVFGLTVLISIASLERAVNLNPDVDRLKGQLEEMKKPPPEPES